MAETPFYPVIIVGAGLAGLTMAYALQQAGIEALLLQTRPKMVQVGAKDPRTTALNAASVEFLQTIGLWDSLADGAAPIHRIAIANNKYSPDCLFRENDSGGQPMGYIVYNTAYTEAVRARLTCAQKVGQIVSTAVEGDRRILTLEDGTQLYSPLVIAADGRNSPLRAMAGLRIRRKDYGQTALTGIVQHSVPHQGTAFEWFTPDGPLAFLPLKDPHESCAVWTLPTPKARSFETVALDLLAAGIEARFGGALGQLTLTAPLAAFPLSAYRAETFHAPHLALIADAAHFLHPLAGQGFNVGLRDIRWLLTSIQANHALGLQAGTIDNLEAYTAARMPDVQVMFRATDTLNTLFSLRLPLVHQARSLGLQLVNHYTPLRRQFVAYACGRGRLASSSSAPAVG